MRLAFVINAHQIANQMPIGSAPAYRARCTLPTPADLPDLPNLVPASSFTVRDQKLEAGTAWERG